MTLSGLLPRKGLSGPAAPVKLSVVVPCYNAAAHLRGCLSSLAAQSRRLHEVIVVDDASTDGSGSVAREFGAVVLRRPERGGAAAARADGAARAEGDVVAFLDADCSAPRDWAEKIAREFEADPTLGGFGGKYSHGADGSLLGRLSVLEEEYVHRVFADRPDEAVPPGGNSAYRKAVWNQARSQKELVYFGGMGSGEDSVVGHEVRQAAKVRFSGDLEVRHSARGGTGYFRRHFNRGISRSTILLNGLSAPAETGLTIEAYGGWRLFAAGLFLAAAAAGAPAAFTGRPAALAWIGACLAAHAGLSGRFFRFAAEYERSLPPGERLGPAGRAGLRVLLLARSCCWIGGGAAGLWRTMKSRAGLIWNVACSILHFWRPGRISKLFFFVNSQCNARCEFCFNLDNVVGWKEREPALLTLSEVEHLAKNFDRLPFLTLSGGEPFLRQDLAALVRAFHERAKTQWVTVPTNASLTERTLKSVQEILRTCPGLFLTIQVSIDSLHEDHDRSRKLNGGFAKMTETLNGLSRLRRHYKNLRVQLGTYFDESNRHRLEEISSFCRHNFEYDQHFFYLLRDARTRVTERTVPLLGDYLAFLRMNEEYEWAHHRRGLWPRAVRALQGLVYNDMASIKSGEPYLRPCHATRKFATLYDDGQVSPCEILEKTSLGNVRDHGYDYYRLTAARQVARFHREEIVAKKCSCDWMCAIPINTLYDVRSVPRAIKAFLRPDRVVGRPRA